MKKIIIATVVLGLLSIAGCVKDDTLTLEPPAVTKTVSFKKDLIPLFTKNCALSGCHDGSQEPNLKADRAYNSLIDDPDFIIIKNPANSTLYKRLTGKLSPAMPMGAAKNPGNINGLVLAWIKQGAKNN